MVGESSLADGSDSKVLDPTSESSTTSGFRCECGALVSSILPSLGELSRGLRRVLKRWMRVSAPVRASAPTRNPAPRTRKVAIAPR